jgi:hypothetical protein
MTLVLEPDTVEDWYLFREVSAKILAASGQLVNSDRQNAARLHSGTTGYRYKRRVATGPLPDAMHADAYCR